VGAVIRVLVVDDDFRVADLHAQFVAAVPGFQVVGVAHSCAGARESVAELTPDLVLLDRYLPDGSGLDLLRELGCDVILVTAASDAASVRAALGRGAVNYLVKPFTKLDLADRLRAYARYHSHLAEDRPLDQGEIDRSVRLLREGDQLGAGLRKGRSTQTAGLVVDLLRASPEPLSAGDVSAELGISRPTAQRYLADLAGDGRVSVTLRYGSTGRPEHRYAWRGGLPRPLPG
jgi:response regulator of citrate/malate metabolism